MNSSTTRLTPSSQKLTPNEVTAAVPARCCLELGATHHLSMLYSSHEQLYGGNISISSILTTQQQDRKISNQFQHTTRMPDSAQNLEARTESRSNVEDDVPATSSATASSGHEDATETPQIPVVFVKVARDSEGNPIPVPGPAIPRPTKSVECNMLSTLTTAASPAGSTCQRGQRVLQAPC